jgi:hypothetical protein
MLGAFGESWEAGGWEAGAIEKECPVSDVSRGWSADSFEENRVCFRSHAGFAGNPLWADCMAAGEEAVGEEL